MKTKAKFRKPFKNKHEERNLHILCGGQARVTACSCDSLPAGGAHLQQIGKIH